MSRNENVAAFANEYNLVEADFSAENTRKEVSKKELAILRALCKTNTLDFHCDVDDTVNADAINTDIDYKLAHTGNAKAGTLISIWSRNGHKHVSKKSDKRDFGVRLHHDIFVKFFATEKFREIVGERTIQLFNHKDGVEVRYSFNKLADAVKFVFDIADALKTDAETTTNNADAVKDITTESADAV